MREIVGVVGDIRRGALDRAPAPAMSLLASYLPARRATRVDPMEALRGD